MIDVSYISLAAQIAAIFVAYTIVVADAASLALWRRWLGGWGGDFPRSIKVASLCAWLGAQYLGAVWPYLFSGAADLATVAAWAGLPVFCAAVSMWFVTAHNNGGPEGTGGPERYGWAGYGYAIAYPFRDTIPGIRIFGSVAVPPGNWTSIGELWLGGLTGLGIGAALGIALAHRVYALVFYLGLAWV